MRAAPAAINSKATPPTIPRIKAMEAGEEEPGWGGWVWMLEFGSVPMPGMLIGWLFWPVKGIVWEGQVDGTEAPCGRVSLVLVKGHVFWDWEREVRRETGMGPDR